LSGKAVNPFSKEWLNFGGDKPWPAPQSEWPQLAGRAWPPPAAFDAAANEVELPGAAGLRPNQIALVSPVDAHYGIRVRRLITLDEKRPVLTIGTTFTKAAGPPVQVSVWVVTQMRSPDRVYALVAPHSAMEHGYRLLIDGEPTDFRTEGNLISFTRGHKESAKVGVDGDTLIWVGKNSATEPGTTLRIDTSIRPEDGPHKGSWPDQGCHAEIYTNPDDSDLGPGLTYIEMETLGPLRLLKQGDSVTQTNFYTLRQRTETDPTAEARKILAE
jgi:regulator of extracellular matrix RemA (YlzA/DUF370 family)